VLICVAVPVDPIMYFHRIPIFFIVMGIVAVPLAETREIPTCASLLNLAPDLSPEPSMYVRSASPSMSVVSKKRSGARYVPGVTSDFIANSEDSPDPIAI
jgi:hypothetical protein